jgi:hypothetical protein
VPAAPAVALPLAPPEPLVVPPLLPPDVPPPLVLPAKGVLPVPPVVVPGDPASSLHAAMNSATAATVAAEESGRRRSIEVRMTMWLKTA